MSYLTFGEASHRTRAEPREQQPDARNPLVDPSDEKFTTDYTCMIMSQMKRCIFSESDRLGKRKGHHHMGYPGIVRKHCFGGNGSGRYFLSSMKTFADVSKTLNVLHAHLLQCNNCPENVSSVLHDLKKRHQREKACLAFGWQKVFL